MKKTHLILLSVIMFATVGCNLIKREQTENVLVEVAGNYLYKNDIVQLLPPNCSPEDSAKIIDRFVQQWATGILMYDNAKRNITNTTEIEKLVNDYRKSLMIHQYEQQLINQRMKKTIPESSIAHFYEKNSADFLLRENIIKGMLLIMPGDAPQQEDVKKWLVDTDTESLEKIEKYVVKYAVSYDYFLDKWMQLRDIEKLLPQPLKTEELKSDVVIEQNDSIRKFMLKVSEFKPTGAEVPYEYARPEIENTILNNQKIEFIRNLEEDLYNDAVKSGKIKRYTEQEQQQ